jgi:hypothetical protein
MRLFTRILEGCILYFQDSKGHTEKEQCHNLKFKIQ